MVAVAGSIVGVCRPSGPMKGGRNGCRPRGHGPGERGHLGQAMDRRLPERRLACRALPVLAGAWLCLVGAAMAADPESRPVSLSSPAAAEGTSFPWLPLVVTLGALAVAAWARWRRGPGPIPSLGGIRILSRTPMGRGRALSLVQVGDRVVLVGESGQGFQRLAEFESDQAPVATSRRVAV
ncbi:MAG: hypothetical protein EBQ99_10720 [Planctomycetes bacterium]|nr:hypothetical protein [Planctomycetota bacterium]